MRPEGLCRVPWARPASPWWRRVAGGGCGWGVSSSYTTCFRTLRSRLMPCFGPNV